MNHEQEQAMDRIAAGEYIEALDHVKLMEGKYVSGRKQKALHSLCRARGIKPIENASKKKMASLLVEQDVKTESAAAMEHFGALVRVAGCVIAMQQEYEKQFRDNLVDLCRDRGIEHVTNAKRRDMARRLVEHDLHTAAGVQLPAERKGRPVDRVEEHHGANVGRIPSNGGVATGGHVVADNVAVAHHHSHVTSNGDATAEGFTAMNELAVCENPTSSTAPVPPTPQGNQATGAAITSGTPGYHQTPSIIAGSIQSVSAPISGYDETGIYIGAKRKITEVADHDETQGSERAKSRRVKLEESAAGA